MDVVLLVGPFNIHKFAHIICLVVYNLEVYSIKQIKSPDTPLCLINPLWLDGTDIVHWKLQNEVNLYSENVFKQIPNE